MSKASEDLSILGFSQYESQAYVTLLQKNPLNGYELARASGVPRPNIYSVLQKLQERGAVVRLDTEDGTRYAPVPSGELVNRLRHQFEASIDAASRALEKVTRHTEPEFIWNTHGYPALLEHARALIDATQEELLLAVWPPEAQALADHTQQAVERGVHLTTLCQAGCTQECGSCHGDVHRDPVSAGRPARWLVLVPDEREVLAGEIQPTLQALAVRTQQKMLVELASGYIRHSIALAAIFKDGGAALEENLSPETLSLLKWAQPDGWSDKMHSQMHGLFDPPTQA